MNPANGLSPPVSATDRSTRMIIDSCTSYTTTPSHTPPDGGSKQQEEEERHQVPPHNVNVNASQTQQHGNVTSSPDPVAIAEVDRVLAMAAKENDPHFDQSPVSIPQPPPSEKVEGGTTEEEPPGIAFLRRRSSDFYNNAVMNQFWHQHPHEHHHEHHHGLMHHHWHHEGCTWCSGEAQHEEEKERGPEAGEPPEPPTDKSAQETEQTDFERFGLGRRWSWSYEDAKQRMQKEWMKRSEGHQGL